MATIELLSFGVVSYAAIGNQDDPIPFIPHSSTVNILSHFACALFFPESFKNNLQVIKVQMHSCTSHHLQCLHCCEAWLYEQVDLIHQLKMEKLQEQA